MIELLANVRCRTLFSQVVSSSNAEIGDWEISGRM